ncbi:hypothetical protein, partial [Falsiroseomonas sp. E2-1-a20]|uniref:hypothetical protein n=1 Tax=Falsiroseomonas sp. E2-1-a20 TaxID=3239300 RepID=UPI003F2A281B
IKAFQSFYGAPLQTQALVRRNSGGGAFSVVAGSALRRSEARAAEAEALLRDCEGRLAAMEASTFWRTSSPFRSYLAANPRMRTAMKQVLQPVWRGLRRLR